MPTKVCIAVDESATSKHALIWAAKRMVREGDEVKVFTVVHPSPESELAVGTGAAAAGARIAPLSAQFEADAQEQRHADAFLRECKQWVVEEGVKPEAVSTDTLVAPGSSADIGRQITSHAEACGCDSLIVGSRGLGFSRKAMMSLLGLGSVSDYVVRHAPCNVALYKDMAKP